jgi:hypothetical protein
MICLNSARPYWDLSDEIPTEAHFAVPEGSHRASIDFPPTRVHVFGAATFGLGRSRIKLERGEHFWISDRERTVVVAVATGRLIELGAFRLDDPVVPLLPDEVRSVLAAGRHLRSTATVARATGRYAVTRARMSQQA